MSPRDASDDPAEASNGATQRKSTFVIAIDGPSGTGKSTVSKEVARALGAGYLDTGALYRIVALHVLDRGSDPADEAAVTEALRDLVFESPTDPDDQRHFLMGTDVTQRIRDADVSATASVAAAHPAVRSFLLQRQREIARVGRMVVEGRDIGTVIAPDADVKIFLTADAEVRAQRRLQQNAETRAASSSGSRPDAGRSSAESDARSVAEALAVRDRRDASRAAAPLQAADDAEVLDSTDHDVAWTVAEVLKVAAAKGIS